MKILTYREPQNPEYREFVNHLKADAKRMFNYTADDSLVSPVCVCVCVLTRPKDGFDIISDTLVGAL